MHAKLEAGDRWALFDCDDSLVDYIGGFGAFASRVLKRKLIGRPDSWDLSGWLGVSQVETISLINQFNDRDIGFEKLKPVPFAVEGVRLLKAYGFNTAIVTSSSVSPSSVERRARNVSTVFGDLIDRLHIVPLGQSKRDILRSYTNSIWVEDHVENASIGAGLGHRAFLLPAGHNARVHGLVSPPPGVIHVRSWEEIVTQAVRLLPDARAQIGVREASLRALEKASEAAGHKAWTPRNPDSDAMRRLADMGVVLLTAHPNRKPTAELTSVGFAVLGIDPTPEPEAEADGPDFEI